jgi:hypothetical protein
MPRPQHLEPPVQITGGAGDVIIAHHVLVHTVAANVSRQVRLAAIARLRHVDCDANGPTGYVEIWREWEGLRPLTSRWRLSALASLWDKLGGRR